MMVIKWQGGTQKGTVATRWDFVSLKTVLTRGLLLYIGWPAAMTVMSVSLGPHDADILGRASVPCGNGGTA